jgi:hypothetical protein
VSVYFEVSGTSIWNPASRIGVLFAEQLEAVARFAEMETGVSTMGADTFVVAPATLAALAGQLVTTYESSNHPVLRSQLRAVLGPLLVLVSRTDVGVFATTDSALLADVDSVEPGMPV